MGPVAPRGELSEERVNSRGDIRDFSMTRAVPPFTHSRIFPWKSIVAFWYVLRDPVLKVGDPGLSSKDPICWGDGIGLCAGVGGATQATKGLPEE